jgi:hypothetical protein
LAVSASVRTQRAKNDCKEYGKSELTRIQSANEEYATENGATTGRLSTAQDKKKTLKHEINMLLS